MACCPVCQRKFRSKRGLTMHLHQKKDCNNKVLPLPVHPNFLDSAYTPRCVFTTPYTPSSVPESPFHPRNPGHPLHAPLSPPASSLLDVLSDPPPLLVLPPRPTHLLVNSDHGTCVVDLALPPSSPQLLENSNSKLCDDASGYGNNCYSSAFCQSPIEVHLNSRTEPSSPIKSTSSDISDFVSLLECGHSFHSSKSIPVFSDCSITSEVEYLQNPTQYQSPIFLDEFIVNYDFPSTVEGFENDDPDYHTSLSKQVMAHKERSDPSSPIPSFLAAQVLLLKKLVDARSPLSLFDEIMKWHLRALELSFSPLPAHVISSTNRMLLSRNQVVSQLKTFFGYEGMYPRSIPIELPDNLGLATVVVHDAEQCIRSLLEDAFLMQSSNLLFPNNNPLSPPDPNPKIRADVDTSSLYFEAYSTYIKVPGLEVLCPIILYSDKTVTDFHGNLSLHPVSFTLGIFNRETRNNPRAWRTLGYVPNVKASANAKTSSDKARIYHIVMDVILHSLRCLQRTGGIYWPFLCYNDESYEVVFKIPILMIIGDTEEHDRMVGRYTSRSTQILYCCRYCRCPTSEIKSIRTFPYTKQDDIRALILQKKYNSLKELCYQPLPRNAFHDLQYCDTDRGINGATPAELIHLVQLGFHFYALEAFFGLKTITQEQRKRNKRSSISKKQGRKSIIRRKSGNDKRSPTPRSSSESDSSSPLIYSAPQETETGKNRFFTPSTCLRFDSHARFYGRLLQHQSSRNLPRCYFSHGVTGNKKKNAHEMQGVLLVSTVILCSSYGYRDACHPLGNNRWSSFIQLFSELIMFEEICKRTTGFTTHEICTLRRYIPPFLDFFKRVVDRKEGAGLDIIKFHLPLHLADDIERFGCPENFNSGPSESRHKTEVKMPAQRTQKRFDTFDYQTATKYTDNLLINLAISKVHSDKAQTSTLSLSSSSGRSASHDKKHTLFGKSFVVSCDKRKQEREKWNDKHLQNVIQDIIVSKILPFITNPSLFCYTALRVDDVLFRANPVRHPKEHWLDWCIIDWGRKHGCIPAQILIFLKIESILSPITIGDTTVSKNGMYALIHSLTSQPSKMDRAHEACPFILWAKKTMDHSHLQSVNDLPLISIVSVESIKSSALCLPADPEKHTIFQEEYLFLHERSLWDEMYFKLMNKSIKN
jgi:Plavaka transposase